MQVQCNPERKKPDGKPSESERIDAAGGRQEGGRVDSMCDAHGSIRACISAQACSIPMYNHNNDNKYSYNMYVYIDLSLYLYVYVCMYVCMYVYI